MVPVIVLQTIAANLGSMLTPIGNPQNLYLYNLSEMNAGEFLCLDASVYGCFRCAACPDDFRFKCKKKKIRLTDCHFSEEKRK